MSCLRTCVHFSFALEKKATKTIIVLLLLLFFLHIIATVVPLTIALAHEQKQKKQSEGETRKKDRQVVSERNKLFLGIGFLHVLLHFLSLDFQRANAFHPSR